MEWIGGWSYTKDACRIQSLHCPEEGKQDSCGHNNAKRVANMPSGWQSLRQRKRNSLQHLHGHRISVSPNRWTVQTRTLLVRIVYAMMLVSLHPLMKTRWRHGLSITLVCSMLSLRGRVMNSPRCLWLSPPSSVSTKERSWGGKTADCFSTGEISDNWVFILDLDHCNYCSLKVTDQNVIKLLERVLGFYIQKRVKIDEMQFGSLPELHLRRNAHGFTIPETWHWWYYSSPSQLEAQMDWTSELDIYIVPRRAPNLSHTEGFVAPSREEGLKKM